MKVIYLYSVTILLLGFNTPVIAQNESGAFDGLQNALGQLADAASDTYESLMQNYQENTHLWWIFGSDIRMKMNAKIEENTDEITVKNPYYFGNLSLYGFKTGKHDESLYAEFDWQNMAESMLLSVSEHETEQWLGAIIEEKKTVAEEFTMYVDAQGYWYVPVEMEGYDYDYVQVDLMEDVKGAVEMLEFTIEAAIASKVFEFVDFWGYMLLVENNSPGLAKFIGEDMKQLFAEGESMPYSSCCETQGKGITGVLKEQLEELAKLQFEKLSHLPPLIHFAFLFSPTLARTQFNVKEESVSFMGQVLTTKMTVLSGKDAGAVVIFDRYGRLMRLIDPDGDTADYSYDKDVTVNIPAAISMGNMSFGKKSKSGKVSSK